MLGEVGIPQGLVGGRQGPGVLGEGGLLEVVAGPDAVPQGGEGAGVKGGLEVLGGLLRLEERG